MTISYFTPLLLAKCVLHLTDAALGPFQRLFLLTQGLLRGFIMISEGKITGAGVPETPEGKVDCALSPSAVMRLS